MPEAARITDKIGHVSIWARLARVALRVGTSLVEGLAVAAVITLAVGGSIATMGCGAIIVGGLIAGFIGSATGWSAYKEKKIQELTEDIGSPDITGMLSVMGSPNVFVNNLFAARAITDKAVCSKHSGPPIPVAEGSDSVWINTFPAARKGDKTQCAAKITEGSPNVFFGGNKTAYLEVAEDKEWWETGLEIVIGLAMAKGSFPGRIGCMGLGLIAGMAGDALGKGFRSLIGYPVNPATGGKVLLGDDDTDFVLPGPLPIEWKRRYSSSDTRVDGMFGAGWSIPYSVELHILQRGTPAEALIFIDDQGRKIDLPAIQPGQGLYNTAELLTIGCTPGGHYEIQTPDGLFYQFGGAAEQPGDQVLRLKRLRDRNDNWLAFRRDDQGRLTNIADSVGRLLRLAYEQAAAQLPRLRAVHLDQGASDENAGVLVRYDYGADGQLSRVVDRTQATVRTFAYVDGLMVQQTFASGFECNYAWEPRGAGTGPEQTRRVLRHWSSDGEHYEVDYQVRADGGQTVAVDQLGRRSRWEWDSHYNLTSFTDPLNRRWTMEWNDASQLLRVVNPGKDVIGFEYNGHGLPEAKIDALGRVTHTLWDDRWFAPLKITLPDGGIYRFEYDERGNNTAVIDPAGQETRYGYNRFGLAEVITDAKGGLKRLNWNARAQLMAFTDCSDKTTRYAYDNWGYLKVITDAAGQQTRLTHDAMGRLLTISEPDNSHQTYSYDSAGRLIGASDALSRDTRFALNPRGQLLARRDAEGRQISLNYDGAQRLQSLVNENGLRFEFTYDAADRVVEERRVGGTRVQVEYDANGQPAAVTHYPGIGDDDLELTKPADVRSAVQPLRTELIRDVAGRLIEKRTAGHHCLFRYDALDQLTEAVKLQVMAEVEGHASASAARLRPLHRTSFEYDKLGNLIAETVTDEITGEQHSLRHDHDALGNRTQTVLPTLPGQSAQRALNYLYYGSGHLHQVNLSRQHGDEPAVHQLISDIERDDLHREIARSQGSLATRFALDPLGRRAATWCRPGSLAESFTTQDATWRQAIDSAGTSQARVLDGLMKEYSYDPVSELRQTRHSLQGVVSHRYDATGRIEETVRAPLPGRAPVAGGSATNHERFAYDPAGNLLDGATSNGGGQGPVRGYVRDNLVRVFEDKRYAYDGHGRLIRKRSGKHTDQRFEWDDESRLVAVQTTRRPGTEHATTQTTRFDYDALGRRVAKHDAFGSTHFIWEGMRLIEERRGASIATYVYEPDSYVPLARLDEKGKPTDTGGLGTADDAIAPRQSVNDDNYRPGEVRYFHTDQVGLPEELSNTEGNLCWRASYKTWGNTVSEQWVVTALDGRPVQEKTQPEIEQNLRFQGQYLDRDTGLHYNTFRFYDPDIGRFINPDPIGLLGGHNLHSYVPNPTAWIDPWGWAVTNYVDFSGKKVFYPVARGQYNEVVIKMQGSRGRDFTLANRAAGIKGGTPNGYTWHHVDYDPRTGRATMQLVTTKAHEASFPHRGSVADFEKHFGVKYGSPAARAIVEKKGWRGKC